MHATAIPAKAAALLADRPTLDLVADFLTTDQVLATGPTADERAALFVTRRWLMDELDARGDLGLLAVALDLCPTCWAHLDQHDDPAGCPAEEA